MNNTLPQYTLLLSQFDPEDTQTYGSKAAQFAKVYQLNLPIKPAFIITPTATYEFLNHNNLLNKLNSLLKLIHLPDPSHLEQLSKNFKKLIKDQEFPAHISHDIVHHYQHLIKNDFCYLQNLHSPFNTSPPIKGDVVLLDTLRSLLADSFTPQSLLSYYQHPNQNPLHKPYAFLIRTIPQSSVSGQIYTLDPITQNKNHLRINAFFGLTSENSNRFLPDSYVVDKTTATVIHHHHLPQPYLLKLGRHGNLSEEKVDSKNVNAEKLTKDELSKLINIALKLHHHALKPQKIDFCIESKEVFIIGIQDFFPEIQDTTPKVTPNSINLKPIVKGIPVSPGIVSGPIRLITNNTQLDKFQSGEILLSPTGQFFLMPLIKKASGIISNNSSATSHLAIAARESGIPMITQIPPNHPNLRNGQTVTINGRTGFIYQGVYTASALKDFNPIAPPTPTPDSKAPPQKLASKILLDSTHPRRVRELSLTNLDGVGRLRGEHFMAEYGLHPAHLNQKQIDIYQQTLVHTLTDICQSFLNRPVYYQLTHLYSHELRNLSFGDRYEPETYNSRLSLHGVQRNLLNPQFMDTELEAIRDVRTKSHCHNLHLIVPGVLNPHDFTQFKKHLSTQHLYRTSNFELLLLIQTPLNLLQLDEYITLGIDGFVFDTDAIAELIMGVDSQNPENSSFFAPPPKEVFQLIANSLKNLTQKARLHTSILSSHLNALDDYFPLLLKSGLNRFIATPDQINPLKTILPKLEHTIIK